MRRSWAIAERLSWPPLLAELHLRAAFPAGDLIEERIDFGEHPSQHVLVCRPDTARRSGAVGSREPRPLVYFLHGGSWRYGSPGRFLAFGRFFARAGYPAALGGYRLLPHTFPAQRDDTLSGITAVTQRDWFTEECGGRIVLAGQSAGGHLAALAAFDEESRGEAGLRDLDIAGVLPVSGVLDFEVLCQSRARCPLIEALMGGRGGWERADPARFARGARHVPVLCLHGSRDPLVPAEVAASFVLRANGAEGDHAVFVADPNGHHADLARIFLGRSPLTPVLLQWLEDLR